MLFAANPEALYENIISNQIDPFDNVFSHSRLTVTPGLIDEYERKFSGITERQIFQSLLSSLGSRLKLVKCVPTTPIASIGGDLQTAANYGGKNLMISSACKVSPADQSILELLGIRYGDLNCLFEPTCLIGFSPFEKFILKIGDNKSPDIIGRFFEKEKCVTFYDKHINSSSIDLINFLIPRLADDCTIAVVTSKNSIISTDKIRAGLVAKKRQKIFVETADSRTTEIFHDRHIFVGSHYQIHIARGLDIFGRASTWNNLNGEICVYDCSLGTDISLSFEPCRGKRRRDIRLKACVIA
ncbi:MULTISPECIES: MIT C-terminal domain-containing protein [unclassified Xanthomonas]|uniref:MIT C-terminal domain-containing protein n=1 Tax=unclassified Xanthomonas TaxID=2643310 RepID=UPI002A81F55D|nr:MULTISPECIES: MIT C-terminal domain-containing protein [unclassified Xanthomonas]MDY4295810.1 MIT C-terminal domain-containing protein [Xanthomonas sp. LF02-5]MDY4357604.1 MIT C-terminal domain-containing protein [Xanthomonas sp. LF04-12]